MNRIFLLILVSIFTVSTASAQTTFLKKLKKGEKQTVVFYGASAAINTSNRVWVDQLRTRLERRFPEKITFYNCSKSGIGSFWATENFKDSVLSRKPDLLIFGFSENDAVTRFNNAPGIRESVRNTWLTICGRRIPMPPSYCIFFPNVRWDNRRRPVPNWQHSMLHAAKQPKERYHSGRLLGRV